MDPVTITLPFPPTTNNLFVTVGRRRVISKPYRLWRERATRWLHDQAPAILTGPVTLDIVFGAPDRRRRDLSNYQKGLEDLLVACGVIEDDSFIKRGSQRWGPHPGAHLRLGVYTLAMQAEDMAGLPLAEKAVEPPAPASASPKGGLIRTKWTKAEDAELRRLWHDGLVTREIAAKVNRSHDAVACRAHLLHLPNRNPAKVLVDRPVVPTVIEPAASAATAIRNPGADAGSLVHADNGARVVHADTTLAAVTAALKKLRVWVRSGTLAEEAGQSPGGTRAAIKQLRADGLVRVTGSRSTTRYRWAEHA